MFMASGVGIMNAAVSTTGKIGTRRFAGCSFAGAAAAGFFAVTGGGTGSGVDFGLLLLPPLFFGTTGGGGGVGDEAVSGVDFGRRRATLGERRGDKSATKSWCGWRR